MNTTHAELSGSRDEGMGLIEITIAMFILALVAVAFLPLLVQGIKQAAANATLVTATQLVHQEIELARVTTCTSSAVTRESIIVDSRGVPLSIVSTIGRCPTTVPGTFGASAQAVRQDTGATLAEAETLVYVQGP